MSSKYCLHSFCTVFDVVLKINLEKKYMHRRKLAPPSRTGAFMCCTRNGPCSRMFHEVRREADNPHHDEGPGLMFGGSETGVVLAGRREERDEEERDEEEKKLTQKSPQKRNAPPRCTR